MDDQPNQPQDMWPEDGPVKPQSPPISQPVTPPESQPVTPSAPAAPVVPQTPAPASPASVSHYSFARDGFIYIISYVTLMLFSLAINHLIKAVISPLLSGNASSSYEWLTSNSMIIVFLATVIIAFPIYAGLSIWANRMLGNGTMRHNTGVRTWLIYLTMVVVVIVVISQLVYLLISFLGGGLPLRVGIHALISILIALTILGYQWWQLKFFDGSPKKLTLGFRIFEWAAIAVVLGALVWGFASIESPATKRARQADSTRISRLMSIARGVQKFYDNSVPKSNNVSAGETEQFYIPVTKSLPQSLENLALTAKDAYTDPKTGERFEYRVTGATNYELCATFEDVLNEKTKQPYTGNKDWYHPKGHFCFDKAVTGQN